MSRRTGLFSVVIACGIGASAILSVGALAQRLAENAAAVWIDGLLDVARRQGATEVKRGAVSFDAASGALAVADVEFTLPGDAPIRVALRQATGRGVAVVGDRLRAAELVLSDLTAGPAIFQARIDRLTATQLETMAIPPAAFLGQGGPGIAAVVAATDARRIEIGTLSFGGTVPAGEQRQDYVGIVIEDLRRGIAARAQIEDQRVETAIAPGNVLTARGGRTRIEQLDLGVHVEFFTPIPGRAPTERLAYGRWSGEPVTGEVTGVGVRFTLGTNSGEQVFLRPMRIGLMEFMRLAAELENAGADATPAQAQAMADALGEFFKAYRIGRFALGASSVETPEGSFRLGGVQGEEMSLTSAGRLVVERLGFQAPQAAASIGRMEIADLEYGRFVDAMVAETSRLAAGGDPLPALEGRLPRIGRLALADVDVDGRDQGRFSMRGAEFSMGRWIGFVPEALRLAVDRLSIPSEVLRDVNPPRPEDLGYRSLDASSDIQLRLDEAGRRFTLGPGRVSVADIGAVDVEVALAGIEARHFSAIGLGDPTPLLQQGRVESVLVRVTNSGFIQRFAQWSARSTGGDARQFIAQMAAGLGAILGGFLPDQAAVNRAVAQLTEDPRTLTLRLTQRQPITLLEIMQAVEQGPMGGLALLPRVAIDIRANE